MDEQQLIEKRLALRERKHQVIRSILAFSRSYMMAAGPNGERPEFFWSDEEMIEMANRRIDELMNYAAILGKNA